MMHSAYATFVRLSNENRLQQHQIIFGVLSSGKFRLEIVLSCYPAIQIRRATACSVTPLEPSSLEERFLNLRPVKFVHCLEKDFLHVLLSVVCPTPDKTIG